MQKLKVRVRNEVASTFLLGEATNDNNNNNNPSKLGHG